MTNSIISRTCPHCGDPIAPGDPVATTTAGTGCRSCASPTTHGLVEHAKAAS